MVKKVNKQKKERKKEPKEFDVTKYMLTKPGVIQIEGKPIIEYRKRSCTFDYINVRIMIEPKRIIDDKLLEGYKGDHLSRLVDCYKGYPYREILERGVAMNVAEREGMVYGVMCAGFGSYKSGYIAFEDYDHKNPDEFRSDEITPHEKKKDLLDKLYFAAISFLDIIQSDQFHEVAKKLDEKLEETAKKEAYNIFPRFNEAKKLGGMLIEKFIV